MKTLVMLFALALGAGAALAQDPPPEPLLPALYDVTGVADDDVLNLRAGPDSSTPVVGALPPDARGVEVLSLSGNGRWGLVATAEGASWASMHYLARQPGQPGDRLPRPLLCSGTEPFWSLELQPREAVFERMDGAPVRLRPVWEGPPEGRRPFALGLRLEGAGAGLQAVVTRELCFDGMSERAYGLSIFAILSGGLGEGMLSGCCSLN